MPTEITPLGFRKPDGNVLARTGDTDISHNAQNAEDLIQDLRSRFPSHFDGGTPGTVYAADQIIDGGTI